MNSIAKALNNIAAALQSISNEMRKNKADVVVSKSATSNPYTGSVNITSTYVSKDSEGWFSLNASEKEQLYYIYKAIRTKAMDPNYTNADIAFTKVMDNLNAHWPSLHAPIYKLISLKKRSIQDKYNKRIDTFSKQISDFPHKHNPS
jgi:predicted nucleotidyltransferase